MSTVSRLFYEHRARKRRFFPKDGVVLRLSTYVPPRRSEFVLLPDEPQINGPVMSFAQRSELVSAVTVDNIHRVVCRHFAVRRCDLLDHRRTHGRAIVRQVSMYLCRQLTTLSSSVVGRLHDRDHSTVLYAYLRVDQLMRASETFAAEVEEMRQKVLQGG